MLVAEWRRLRPDNSGVGHVGRALELNGGPKQYGHNKYRTKDGGAGNCVRTAMKNLHRLGVSVQRERMAPGSCSLG